MKNAVFTEEYLKDEWSKTMNEPKRENPVKDYVDYLKRTARTSGKSLLQHHQEAISKEVARDYGLTKEQILQLDIKLVDWRGSI